MKPPIVSRLAAMLAPILLVGSTEALEHQEPLTSAEAAAALGSPDQLEAHLYGRLYLGWRVEGPVEHDGDFPALVARMRKMGLPVWAAMRFEGGQVELQFELPSGERRRLVGTNPAEGMIALASEDGTRWRFDKVVLGDAILWGGRSDTDPTETLLIYRPGSAITGPDDPLDRLAPEAFLYVQHVGDEAFHQSRFPHLHQESTPGIVERIERDGGLVSGLTVRAHDGTEFAIRFPSPRPPSRVPATEGYPVSLSLRDGVPAHLGISLVPLSWRRNGLGRLELEMVSGDLAELEYDDDFNARIPAARLESLQRIVVEPDYAILNTEVHAQWHLAEDKIVWTVGDEGAAMLELEGLDLASPGVAIAVAPSASVPGPWRPLSEAVDFPTNQLRMQNLNSSYGYSIALP